MGLVFVELGMRGRRSSLRPGARDAEVPGVAAATARDGRSLSRWRATEVRQQRRGRVEVGHRLSELCSDELGRGPRQVAVRLVRLIEDARQSIGPFRRLLQDAAYRS